LTVTAQNTHRHASMHALYTLTYIRELTNNLWDIQLHFCWKPPNPNAYNLLSVTIYRCNQLKKFNKLTVVRMYFIMIISINHLSDIGDNVLRVDTRWTVIRHRVQRIQPTIR